MGTFTFALIFYFVVFLSAEAMPTNEPSFPTFSGDYTGTATLKLGKTRIRLRFWYSEALKSMRIDFKGYEGRENWIVLEKSGPYGTSIKTSTRFGPKECSYELGTAKDPIKYEPLFHSSKTPKYLGTEIENGVELQKWQIADKSGEKVLFVRQGENGPFPVRAVSKRHGILEVETLTREKPPASIFKYNLSNCNKKRHFREAIGTTWAL